MTEKKSDISTEDYSLQKKLEQLRVLKRSKKLSTSTNESKGLYSLDWTLGAIIDPDDKAFLIDRLAPKYISLDYDREHFLSLLSHTFSLDFDEKRRVISSLVGNGLTQDQVTELIKVFEDERIEFEKLLSTERKQICHLYFKSIDSWARILWGSSAGRLNLSKLLSDAINDDILLPKELGRGPSFWKIALAYGVSWGVSVEVAAKIIGLGSEGNENFPIEVADFIYRENIRATKSRVAYISHRYNILMGAIIPACRRLKDSIVLARLYLFGAAADAFSLGLAEDHTKHILDAERILTALPEEKGDRDARSARDTKVSLLSAKLNFASAFGDIDSMNKILIEIGRENKSSIFQPSVIDPILYSGNIGLAQKILSIKIDPERISFSDHFGVALDLFICASIASDVDAINIAAFALSACLPSEDSLMNMSHADARTLFGGLYLLKISGVFDLQDVDSDAATDIDHFINLLSKRNLSENFHLTTEKDYSSNPFLFSYFIARFLSEDGETSRLAFSAIKRDIIYHSDAVAYLLTTLSLYRNQDCQKKLVELIEVIHRMSSGMLLGFKYEATLKLLEPALSATVLSEDVMKKINNNPSKGSIEIPDDLLRIGAA